MECMKVLIVDFGKTCGDFSGSLSLTCVLQPQQPEVGTLGEKEGGDRLQIHRWGRAAQEEEQGRPRSR